MKTTLLSLFLLTSGILFAQNPDYKVSSYLDEGFKAPNTHYIGEAWLNAIINNDKDLGYNITKVTFKANILVFIATFKYYVNAAIRSTWKSKKLSG